MNKITALLLLILFFVSCTTNQSVIQTTKKSSKVNPSIVKTKKKSVIKVLIENESISKQDQNYTQSQTQSYNQNTQILEATTRVKVTNEMILEYIETYKEVAQSNMKKFGIPASIILGQAILESGAGTGALSSQANNHFGIKCNKDWLGESVKHDDDSIAECFRKYDNVLDSFKDHAFFLTSKTRYSSLFKLNKTDYNAWAKGLKEAGYATDPQYPTKLIGLIERFQLYKFDVVVIENEVVVNSKEQVILNSTEYQVVQGDTLYSISKKFNISVTELKNKNNISNNTISIGQNIKIN